MVDVEKNPFAASGIPGPLKSPLFWAIIPIATSVTVWAAAPYFWLGAMASTTACAAIAGVTGAETGASVDAAAVAAFRRGADFADLLTAFGSGSTAASISASACDSCSCCVSETGAIGGMVGATGSDGGDGVAVAALAGATVSEPAAVADTGGATSTDAVVSVAEVYVDIVGRTGTEKVSAGAAVVVVD